MNGVLLVSLRSGTSVFQQAFQPNFGLPCAPGQKDDVQSEQLQGMALASTIFAIDLQAQAALTDQQALATAELAHTAAARVPGSPQPGNEAVIRSLRLGGATLCSAADSQLGLLACTSVQPVLEGATARHCTQRLLELVLRQHGSALLANPDQQLTRAAMAPVLQQLWAELTTFVAEQALSSLPCRHLGWLWAGQSASTRGSEHQRQHAKLFEAAEGSSCRWPLSRASRAAAPHADTGKGFNLLHISPAADGPAAQGPAQRCLLFAGPDMAECLQQMAACAADLLEAVRPGSLCQGSNVLKSLELALQAQRPPGQTRAATDFSSIAGTGLTPRAVEAPTDQPGADGLPASAVLPGHQRLQVIQQEDNLLACLVEVPFNAKAPRLPITGSLWGFTQQLSVVVKHANDQKLHKCESKEFMK